MRNCNAFVLGMALAVGAASSLHAQNPHSVQDLADTKYECATAMIYAEELGEPFAFPSRVLFDEFDDLVKQGADRTVAAAFAKEQFELFTKGKSQQGAEDYIVDLARDCEQLMLEREAMRIEKERAAAASRPITVADLRAHFEKNRNLPVIVDYILDRHPGGKPLMGDPIPEGEFLAELLLHVGKNGVKALSDSALVTIVNRPFWQYNPPASKLAQAEYSRRLRARKYSQNEARNWAKRVETERRESLRRSASETAKRWGGGITCTNVAPNGLEGKSYNSCKLMDGY
ncbi:MAG: hypothetical protein AAF291_12095 [Pseudomonadota bacterium]